MCSTVPKGPSTEMPTSKGLQWSKTPYILTSDERHAAGRRLRRTLESPVDTHNPTCIAPSQSGRAIGRYFVSCRSLRRFASCGLALCSLAIAPLYGADQPTGRDIYQQHCVLCHGVQGEGSEEHYPHPLAGDRSVAQLARFIAKSMPPDMPGTCTEKDAQRGCNLYLQASSTRGKRGRDGKLLESKQLASQGSQYTNTIADLMVAFFGSKAPAAGQGLRGNYATINANGDGKNVFSRVDPEVRFDFGTSSPKPGEIDPAEFAISWTGSILAPATGEYEFIVRSPNSFSLFVNDRKTPLIDAWVKSGDQTEFRGTVRLLAGRSYLLQLNFTKAGQGGKKTEQLRARIGPAAISLAWKPPGRGEETIPARHLSPQETRETLLLETAFPRMIAARGSNAEQRSARNGIRRRRQPPSRPQPISATVSGTSAG